MADLTLTRSDAEAIGIAFSWKNCGTWDDAKLLKRIKNIVKSCDIPKDGKVFEEDDFEDDDERERFDQLFAQIAAAKDSVEIESGESNSKDDDEDWNDDEETKAEKEVDEEATEEEDDDWDEDEEEEVEPEPEPEEKPKKEKKKEKKANPEPEPEEDEEEVTDEDDEKVSVRKEVSVGKDQFGAGLGTKTAKINAVILEGAFTPKTISERSGISKASVYAQIQKLKKKGLIKKNPLGEVLVVGEEVKATPAPSPVDEAKKVLEEYPEEETKTEASKKQPKKEAKTEVKEDKTPLTVPVNVVPTIDAEDFVRSMLKSMGESLVKISGK